MNFDDFEQKLALRKIKPLPKEWRAEILESAACSIESKTRPVDGLAVWWRNLLWPNPSAWAGLAGVWVLIVVLNLAITDEAQTAKAEDFKPRTISKEWSMVMEEQKLLRAELMGWTAERKPEKTKEPQPRSDAGANQFSA